VGIKNIRDDRISFLNTADVIYSCNKLKLGKRELFRRDLSAIYIRLLCNLCDGMVISKVFTIENGVKQEGIVSPVLFCIYVDGLLLLLRGSKIGCFIDNVFV